MYDVLSQILCTEYTEYNLTFFGYLCEFIVNTGQEVFLSEKVVMPKTKQEATSASRASRPLCRSLCSSGRGLQFL